MIKVKGYPLMKAVSKVNSLHVEVDKLYIKGISVEDAFYELFTSTGQQN